MEDLVSVVILTHNRKDELCRNLGKLRLQDYHNLEIIVVDNGSNDGTAEMIKAEFAEVSCVKLPANIGAPGFNAGMNVARGSFILLLDDDSYPDLNSIRAGVQRMNGESRIGIIAYNIINLRTDLSETADFAEPLRLFNGCGALLRKELFLKIGGYNELYFLYLNELDYSARCYNAGYKIIYAEDLFVFHSQLQAARIDKSADPFRGGYRYEYYFTNYIIFLWQSFPLFYAFLYSFKWIANRLIICIFYSYYKHFFSAVFKTIRLFPEILENRKPLNKEVCRLYQNGNVQLLDPVFFSKS